MPLLSKGEGEILSCSCGKEKRKLGAMFDMSVANMHPEQEVVRMAKNSPLTHQGSILQGLEVRFLKKQQMR